MMAAWSCALSVIKAEPIPVRSINLWKHSSLKYTVQTFYFARDDRVYKAFAERLEKHEDIVRTKLGRRLRWQLNALRTHLEGRSRTYRVSVIFQINADPPERALDTE